MLRSIELKAAIQKSASRIGKSNGSSPPESASNTFGIAYELFVASELRSIANKRYEKAKEAAVSAGVLDEEKAIEGSEVAVAEYEFFDVTLKKAAGSLTLDKTLLKSYLMKNGATEAEANEVITNSSKPRKGAVTVGFSLKG